MISTPAPTNSLRDYLRQDVGTQISELRARKERLEKELADLEVVEQALRAADEYESAAAERIKEQWGKRSLEPEDVRDKTQREILIMLAGWNRNWLAVQHAIRLMTEAGVFPEPTNASAQIYTFLSKSKDFEPVTPGLYRLVAPTETKKPSSPQARSGLVDEVAAILKDHPSWDRATVVAELERRGWGFDGKKPIFSVAIAFANLARRGKLPRIS